MRLTFSSAKNTFLWIPFRKIFSFALLFGLGFSLPLAQANDCTARSILTRFQVRGDPFTQAKRPESLASLALEVRALFLAEIQSASISQEHKDLLSKRLMTLKIETRSCEKNKDISKATYYSLWHTIKICDYMIKYPEFGLVVLLAHEMGHSMDLCYIHGAFFENKQGGKIPKFNPAVDDGWEDFLKIIYESKSKYFTVGDFLDRDRGKEIFEKLISEKKIVQVDKGIPIKDSPLTESYRCLSKGGSYPPLKENQTELCQGSKYSEAGAQIWSAKVSAAYLKAKYFRMNRVDLTSMFSLMKIPTKQGRLQSPRGKEKDFNEIFLPQSIFRSSFECQSTVAPSCI